VLAVLSLIDSGGLGERLGDLGREIGVGRRGGVGLDLGAVQGDQARCTHPGRRAQLQRLNQQAGQGLFVTDPEPGESYQGESRMLDSPEDVCAGQAGFEYPATSVLFST
jgi:hypothetical protein